MTAISRVGVAAAPVAGRLADRRGPRVVLIWGTVITLSSFAFRATAGRKSLLGLGLGVVVLDVGATVAMIANQARVYALRSDARGRLNTVYSTGVFLAGALGTFAVTRGYVLGGWLLVSGLGALLASSAVAAYIACSGDGGAAITASPSMFAREGSDCAGPNS